MACDLFIHNYQAVRVTGWGRALHAPVDVKFSEDTQVQPDINCIRRERLPIYRGHTVFGGPDVVVEILSPSNRTYDQIKKANLYAANGVPEFWLGDPDAPDLTLFALRACQYAPVPPVDGFLHSTLVPDLAIDLAKLFADLDE